MIKFLKNFFKLGKEPIHDEIENPKEPNEINTSWEYKQIRNYTIQNPIENFDSLAHVDFNKFYKHFNDTLEYLPLKDVDNFIFRCKEEAIKDDDLLLFSILFFKERKLFLKKIKNSYNFDSDTDITLDYAQKALQYDKLKIYECLINYYDSEYPGYIYHRPIKKVKLLMNDIIDGNKIQYYDILEKCKLTTFTSYILTILEDKDSFSSQQNSIKNIERITFILDKCSDSVDNKDFSHHIYRVTTYEKKVFLPEVLELFENFDFVKKRNESKKLADELNDELTSSSEITQSQTKPKKLKV